MATARSREPDTPEDAQRAMSRIGSGASKVQLWRIGLGGARAWIDEYDASAFSMPWLKATQGAGRYLVVFNGPEDVKLREEVVDVAADPVLPPQQQSADQTTIAHVLARMDRLLELQHRGPPPSDPMESTMKMLASIGPLVLAQMQPMMEMMKQLQQPQREQQPIALYLEALQKGIEMGQLGEGSPLAAVAPQFLGLIEKAIDKQSVAQPQQSTGREVHQPMKREPMVPKLATPLAQFAPHMPDLMDLSMQHGADPAMWAVAIESRDPSAAEFLCNLVDKMGEEKVVAAFFGTFPDATEPPQRREWFVKLLHEITVADDDE